METSKVANPSDTDDLLRRALDGDEAAFVALFDAARDRLRRMVRLRLDRRLSGRVDESDVLQDAYLEARRRLADYARDPGTMPVHLWLRLVTGQTLTDLHRRHLGARMRDAGLEVALHRGAPPAASSASMAAQLFGKMTSASRAAIRAEHAAIVQEALDGMDAIDREVLALRHFEHLSNAEVALSLGLTRTAASNRYIRALKRLKEILSSVPGLGDPL
ncbi:sigma-70 family RNA polymerase sigma factor [Tautonia plasticadhaerens]|uniref:RNA polymerase sigma factor n=1 Tax=Tautonia plasticadhaerens TaxID=2527974 RepID=A0A518H829_9BACT|nr:sigma-70 family RNA polymerase sigma factor [Tautonia plasticadhaerens]QDV36994.1 RNA polymerase sigma factor [Tautonia plasticadhaerens]